jgi:competence ComEA-like helix-hairpin-helix protein
MWKQFLKDYFNYTLKERTGIIILLAIIGMCFCVPFFYPYFIHHKVYDHSQFDSDIAKLKLQHVDTSSKKYYTKKFDEDNYNNYNEPSEKKYYTNTKAEVFNFDPNTASTADWKRLGIRDKTIETIQKYLSKGGHFYKPEDISKIWGLHEDDIKRLLPYVTIESKKNDYAKNDYTNNTGKQNNYTNAFSKEKKPDLIVEINSADTTAFIALPGIGSKLAQRIINFREKLGGFYSVEQVGQTFGLPDSTFQKIRQKLALHNASLKKLNINTASMDELKVHPYIRYNLANAIIQYRTQHGNFSSVNDIKNIMLVNDDLFSKVSPYLIAEK